MIEARIYPWSNGAAASASSADGSYTEVLGVCLVAAVLLTLVLWLVPALPGYGFERQTDQMQVAFTFLSGAGLMIILATHKTLRLRRNLRGGRYTALAISSLCALTVLLLVFMGMLVTLLSTTAFYRQNLIAPAESAFFFLAAAGLSLLLLLKFMLKVRQPKSVSHA